MSRDMEILGVAFEIVTLRKKLSDLSWSESNRIKDIPGNEIAKRVIEVAAVHGHSIGFFGQDIAHRLSLIAAGFGVPAFAIKPCPCGRYGNMREPCACSISSIKNYQKRKDFQTVLNADMFVDVDEYQTTPTNQNEDAATILARVQNAQVFEKSIPDSPEYAMTDAAKDLLQLAVRELELTTSRVELVKNLARSIMVLEGTGIVIHAHHIAEVCQYIRRPLGL